MFGMSTSTACATVLFVGLCIGTLVQSAQFGAYKLINVIYTGGTKALSQTQNTISDF